MRWCSHCRRYNTGWPMRCHYCSAGLAGRLCKRNHINPPDPHLAFCGECGEPLERSWGAASSLRVYGLAFLIVLLTVFVSALPILLAKEEPMLSPLIALLILIVGFRLAVGILPPAGRSFLAFAFRGICNLISTIFFGTGLKGGK